MGSLPIGNGVHRGHMDYFLCVIGMVMILEGLPYFAFPERLHGWLRRIQEAPVPTLRKFGAALMLVGLGLVYLGRS